MQKKYFIFINRMNLKISGKKGCLVGVLGSHSFDFHCSFLNRGVKKPGIFTQ